MSRYSSGRKHSHRDPAEGGSWSCAGCRAARDAEFAELEKAVAARKTNPVKTIYLSSRGWGDYSSVQWTGDVTRPDSEIVAECRALLAAGHDVDNRDQTEEQLLAKIAKAREGVSA